MANATNLLNGDGSASMATALMMAHHGFRRDLRRFRVALDTLAEQARAERAAALAKAATLRDEWRNYLGTLHAHHEAEDSGVFLFVQGQRAELASATEQLTRDHQRIDAWLERGQRAFSELPRVEAASEVIDALAVLLDEHLSIEEALVVPYLREAKDFPPPGSEGEADSFAHGFAWSSQGIAPEVLDKVYAMLPDNVTSKLPAARAAFDARCRRVWGITKAGASRTSVPECDTR